MGRSVNNIYITMPMIGTGLDLLVNNTILLEVIDFCFYWIRDGGASPCVCACLECSLRMRMRMRIKVALARRRRLRCIKYYRKRQGPEASGRPQLKKGRGPV